MLEVQQKDKLSDRYNLSCTDVFWLEKILALVSKAFPFESMCRLK